MNSGSPSVAIVGGGVSGLATAFYLKRLGIRSTIVEQSERLGGLIRTDRVQGCQLEAGPDSFIATKPAVAELADELGIADQLIGSNDSGRKIFLVRRGRLVAMPKGMVMMVPSDWKATLTSPLFSLTTKARFLREYTFQPRRRTEDLSIREMMSQHFGDEAVAYLTEPLLSGVYGGNAASLSALSVLPRFVEYEAKYGSLIRGVRAARNQGKGVDNHGQKSGKSQTVPVQTQAKASSSLFLSFAGGMQCLTDSLVQALAGHADIVYRKAEAVRRTASGWRVQMDGRSLDAQHVVLACAAHKSAELLSDSAQVVSGLLSQVPYSSSILATLLFRRDQVAHPLSGFGFLVPPPERRTVAAVTWINTKFPSRVNASLIAIRAFLVDPEAERHGNSGDDHVLSEVLADLRKYMSLEAVPVYAKVYRWPKSMPQYVVGHSARISQIQHELARWPGLHVASNFLDGVGIPDCVRTARSTATQIAR